MISNYLQTQAFRSFEHYIEDSDICISPLHRATWSGTPQGQRPIFDLHDSLSSLRDSKLHLVY